MSEFETLVNNVFNTWKCKKTKPSIYLLYLYRDCDIERKKSILCVKIKNPFTNESAFASVDDNQYCTGALATNYSISITHTIFKNIVTKCIYEQFELVSVENTESKFESEIHTLNRGRQFIEMLETQKHKIAEYIRSLNKDYEDNIPLENKYFSYYNDFYYAIDSLENLENCIMNYPKEISNTGDYVFQPYTFDGDKLVEILENYGYDDETDVSSPFIQQIESLVAYLWYIFKPEVIPYIEVDNAVDFKDYTKDWVEIFNNMSKVNEHIANVISTIDNQTINHILDSVIKLLTTDNRYRYKNYYDMIINLKNETDLNVKKKIISNYMSDTLKSLFMSAYEDYLEF